MKWVQGSDNHIYSGPYAICKAFVGDETRYTAWSSGKRLAVVDSADVAKRACEAHKRVSR